MLQLPYERKEMVALAIYDAKPDPEELKRGKRPAFLTYEDVGKPFVLSSGCLSPYYIDLRVVQSFPRAYRTILDQMEWYIAETVGKKRVKFILSTESAGIFWGSQIAARWEKPFAYVRKKPKDYGTGKLVEGYIPTHSKGVIVDDLVTTLKTVDRAVEGAKREGAEVLACFVIFNRRQYTPEELKNLQTPLYWLIDIFDFLEIGSRTGKLNEGVAEQIRKYHENEEEYIINIIESNPEFIRRHPRKGDVVEYYRRRGFTRVVDFLKEILAT